MLIVRNYINNDANVALKIQIITESVADMV